MPGGHERAEDAALARKRVDAVPLEEVDVSRPEIYRDNTFQLYFARLRREDPVHYCRGSRVGPYWSITKYNDVMTIESRPEVFSSDIYLGGFNIQDVRTDRIRESFLAMDDPVHAQQRKSVMPMFKAGNLERIGRGIRERTARCLDGLPRDEEFDWVERVSIELTAEMLATLFDLPWENRHQLTRWSEVATAAPGNRAIIASEVARENELQECCEYFMQLWDQRKSQPPKGDLISMMAHSEAGREMTRNNIVGNVLMLIVGCNDTTRNAMSGGLYALCLFPDEYRKLRAAPSLIDGFVQEVIRWQTPLSHMRRTAVQDFELRGKQIRKGDKVVMWYASANRDEEVISRADELIVDRKRPRNHLSFGSGVHRCVGMRLAELQLKVLWQQLLACFDEVKVVGAPTRTLSNFVCGYDALPALIPG
jgi:cytochrome P450